MKRYSTSPGIVVAPSWLARLRSIEDGRAFGQGFFRWYNEDHRHSGLWFLTPAVVHFDHAARVRDQRRQVLHAAYAAHPERFVKGRPQPADLPSSVWINPPVKKTTAQDATGATIVTVDDPWVDSISTAPDYDAVSIIGVTATLISSPIVSQCH